MKTERFVRCFLRITPDWNLKRIGGYIPRVQGYMDQLTQSLTESSLWHEMSLSTEVSWFVLCTNKDRNTETIVTRVEDRTEELWSVFRMGEPYTTVRVGREQKVVTVWDGMWILVKKVNRLRMTQMIFTVNENISRII